MKISKINGYEVQDREIILDTDYIIENKKTFGKFPLEMVAKKHEEMVLDFLENCLKEKLARGLLWFVDENK